MKMATTPFRRRRIRNELGESCAFELISLILNYLSQLLIPQASLLEGAGPIDNRPQVYNLSPWASGPRTVMKTPPGMRLVSPHIRLLAIPLFSRSCGTFSMVPHMKSRGFGRMADELKLLNTD